MSITNPTYIEQYRKLHNSKKHYGESGAEMKKEIELFIKYFKPKTLLDYGCGKGKLIDLLKKKYPKIEFFKYDPSIKEYDTIPVRHVDMIVNTDVFEHIPEKDLDDVLKHIASLCNYAYFNLHHATAAATLPCGENAHCTIKAQDWYCKKMVPIFKEITSLPGRHSFTSVIITREIPPFIEKKYMEILYFQKTISSLKTTIKNALLFIRQKVQIK